MTNLLEKALLMGFGIIVLTIFISLINPFIVQISDFNENNKSNIEQYENLFHEVDTGIKFIIENPNGIFSKPVEYPKKLNITLTDFYCKFEYIINDNYYYKIFEYLKPFIDNSYIDLPESSYILKISSSYNFVVVQFN
ncbi:MAG: hypothetical protein EAX91_10955 [Candidatus Lokiarchaeota archaeon]|nr:hypothetical protein [Candidatus Lokiarchaeota archaeon]